VVEIDLGGEGGVGLLLCIEGARFGLTVGWPPPMRRMPWRGFWYGGGGDGSDRRGRGLRRATSRFGCPRRPCRDRGRAT
jgi:hypothetical protein